MHMVRETYQVVARPRQRDPFGSPDEWAVMKGNTVVKTFDTKRPAAARAKELAKNQNETLAVFDAAKKSSQQFDYRSEEEKRRESNRANRKSVKRGLGDNFGPL